MTARDDLDRRLHAWFAADAAPREPEHLLGQVLARTARTRRRPAWRIPERWILVGTLSTAAATMPRVPWRAIGLAVLLLLALVVGAVLVAGSRPTNVPAPFGPAANGLIAYAAEGDIYTFDQVTGRSSAIVTGTDADRDPVWSLDGTRVAFVRTPEGGRARLYVAGRDGRDARAITPELDGNIGSISFSPDGQEVIFHSGATSRISIARVDGSGMRTIELPMPAFSPVYRPPDGAEITFVGIPTSDTQVGGIYAVGSDGSGLRTLVKPSRARTVSTFHWSPDGLQLAYSVADFTVSDWTVTVHIMAPDGSGDRTLPAPAGARWSDYPTWSNDGKHLAILRGYSPHDEDVVAAILPADGSSAGVEAAQQRFQREPVALAWAPDDSALIVMPAGLETRPLEPQVVDPDTGGTVSSLGSWTSSSVPSWQRLAP